MSIVPNMRGPLGLKAEKPAKKPRKAMRKRSKKREAYLASPERDEAKAHMAAVAMLPCLVCGVYGVEVHHEYGRSCDPSAPPRSDKNILPLCPRHHRREYGPGAYHYSPSAFYEAHGSSAELLARVDDMLRDDDDEILGKNF